MAKTETDELINVLHHLKNARSAALRARKINRYNYERHQEIHQLVTRIEAVEKAVRSTLPN